MLWWGSMGNSTEHTAYLRLKHGDAGPGQRLLTLLQRQSRGRADRAQIFIDGWAMVAPGDRNWPPTSLIAPAASTMTARYLQHQVLAAMEALAFVESDLNVLIDTALTFHPRRLGHPRLIDIREVARRNPTGARPGRSPPPTATTNTAATARWSPITPSSSTHCSHGEDDFQKSLMIVNTSGWDTDCNSNPTWAACWASRAGLAGIDHGGPDWRTPMLGSRTCPRPTAAPPSPARSQRRCTWSTPGALAGRPPVAPKDGAISLRIAGLRPGLHAGQRGGARRGDGGERDRAQQRERP
ncbi:MAG: hypothetical protein R2854_29535 [Caldilineaceae bacterium]